MKLNRIALGLADFFTAVGSGMATPVRVLLLVTVLYLSMPAVGLLEGLAAFAGNILRLLPDRWPLRRGRPGVLLALGYVLANAARPMLALAGGWQGALVPMLLGGAGGGIRNAYQDADLVWKNSSNRANPPGLYRLPYLIGTFVGALATAFVLLFSLLGLRDIFALTLVPGLLALLSLLPLMGILRRTPPISRQSSVVSRQSSVVTQHSALSTQHSALDLGVRFWMFTGWSFLSSLGSLSVAFLLLRTAGLTQSAPLMALVYVLYTFVCALLAVPLGTLGLRWGPLPVLLSAYSLLGLSYAGWTLATQDWNVWPLFLAYGVYSSLTAGVSRSLVRDLAPQGTQRAAFAWFYIITGLGALLANTIGGWLWAIGGPQATFSYAMWVSVVSVSLIFAWLPWLRRGYPSTDHRVLSAEC